MFWHNSINLQSLVTAHAYRENNVSADLLAKYSLHMNCNLQECLPQTTCVASVAHNRFFTRTPMPRMSNSQVFSNLELMIPLSNQKGEKGEKQERQRRRVKLQCYLIQHSYKSLTIKTKIIKAEILKRTTRKPIFMVEMENEVFHIRQAVLSNNLCIPYSAYSSTVAYIHVKM